MAKRAGFVAKVKEYANEGVTVINCVIQRHLWPNNCHLNSILFFETLSRKLTMLKVMLSTVVGF